MHTHADTWNGETLRKWRLSRSKPLTQAKAAEWYGVTERQWRRYETNECRVPTPLIRRITNKRGAA